MTQIEFSEQFIDILKSAKKVAALTGAGISAESGVPTFRGKDGWWKNHDPMTLATYEAFTRDPVLVWEWYLHRRNIVHKSKPNPGHYALAEMAKLYDDFTLITQNVDRFHMDAGSELIYELHGNIHRNRCIECGFTDYTETFPELPPKCPECEGKFRPDVVWFGEMLPHDAIDNSMRAANNADLFFSVGTSAAVQPAASLPIIAKQNGAFVVEVNLEPSGISHMCDVKYQGKSGEILPHIIEKIKELKGIDK